MIKNNINEEWLTLLERLILEGEQVNPRSQGTIEILGYQSKINMSYPIITLPERKLNYKFMLGEAWWILSGSNRVADITQYMKNIARFSDNGITFRGAYGPKVVEQLDYVTESLIVDKDSRQALMTIWRESPRPSKDIPCTVALQFIIRDGKLNCMATMRSSDAWLGWTYDTFNFSAISAWIAIALRKKYPFLTLGDLYLTAGSQHLYDRNVEEAMEILKSNSGHISTRPIDLNRYQSPDKLLEDIQRGANGQWAACTPFMSQVEEFKDFP